MWVPVAVWQPCELIYTCYLLLNFYRPDALPAAQRTASKHWRHNIILIIIYLPTEIGRARPFDCFYSEMTYIVSSGALNSTPTNYCSFWTSWPLTLIFGNVHVWVTTTALRGFKVKVQGQGLGLRLGLARMITPNAVGLTSMLDRGQIAF